jgi:hypothetical protein
MLPRNSARGGTHVLNTIYKCLKDLCFQLSIYVGYVFAPLCMCCSTVWANKYACYFVIVVCLVFE